MDIRAEVAAALRGHGARVVVSPPQRGPGHWAGAPSATFADGTWWLAYRVRHPERRGVANMLARSADGVAFDTVAAVSSDEFGAASLERPALVRLGDGRWRLYVSCSTPGSKHWWVEAIDADDPAALPTAPRQVTLPGDEASGWKDVVVHRHEHGWRMWACRHLLADGPEQADRMETWYATSDDGLSWRLHGAALAPRPGRWDSRGTRITCVLHDDGQWIAFYDGRATAAENWHERTGVASGTGPDAFAPGMLLVDEPGARRYLDIVATPNGRRLFWEAEQSDGTHVLVTASASE